MTMTTPDPIRDFPDEEIASCLSGFGSWMGWMGDFPAPAIRALQWKASQGDELPEDLEPIRDAIAQFGYAPIEEAVARVQGLEGAFAEISELMKAGISVDAKVAQAIRDIVDACVKYSGDFGDDEEGVDDA